MIQRKKIERNIAAYIDLLLEENRKYNLTRIVHPPEVMEKHFMDSLIPIRKAFGFENLSGKWIDIGSGAGFPGLPIAMSAPSISMTLVDSTGKKCEFLKLAVDRLDLKNVTIVKGRGEQLARQTNFREQFTHCTARALAKLPAALELTSPFVHPDGIVMLWLSSRDASRLESSSKALNSLSLKYNRTIQYQTSPERDLSTCVILTKTTTTSPRYPRRNGIPGKRPLPL